MDVKLLSTIIGSGRSRSPPPPLHYMSSRASSFLSPFSSPEDDRLPPPPPPSPPSLASSSSSTSSLEALEEVAQKLPPFTPYSAQVPWHTGPRALFSQVFPKYGHYCGPNWSSGRNNGSLFWDKPPIDWLDHCCFCHDIGYDSHDQAQLYKADLELLDCLQKMPPPLTPKQMQRRPGNSPSHQRQEHGTGAVAWFYRNVYLTGLQTFLLPYRRRLLRDMGLLPRNEQ